MARPVHPATFRAFVYHATRSRRFLWKLALSLLAAGAAVGIVGSHFQRAGPWNIGDRVAALSGGTIQDSDDDALPYQPPAETGDVDPISLKVAAAFQEELRDAALTFEQMLFAIPKVAPLLRASEIETLRAPLAERLGAGDGSLAFDYLAGLSRFDPAAIERLTARCQAHDCRRLARYALGQIEMKQRRYQEAYRLFREEGRLPQAVESRQMAIRALIKAKDYATLVQLRTEPSYRPFFTPGVSLEIAILSRDWRRIIVSAPQIQIETFEAHVLAVTLLVGAAWAFFLAHLGEAPRPWSAMSLLCFVGFGLGVLSTVPTVYAAIWQDEILGLSVVEDVPHTILYFVAGVGVREELCKLLLFAPLLPFLIRRDDEFEALIVASFVGLGFAIEENGGYFLLSQASSAPGRFLTANFFHVALTGANGLALFRACTRGTAGMNDLLAVLPLTIVAHGLYDAFLSLPQVDETGTISMIIFVVYSTFYFNRVHQLRNNIQTTISVTGAFVLSISVVAGTMLAFQMMNLGARAGAGIMMTELLGSAVLLVMFFREFREPLSE